MQYDPQQPHPQVHLDQRLNPPPFADHLSPAFPDFTIPGSPSPIQFSASHLHSRSLAPIPPAVNTEPPSTNGGPTRTIRSKGNSISSVPPPPRHRPLSHPHRDAPEHAPTSATSPLSLHILNENSSSWFVPSQQQQPHDFRHNEFNLRTSESVGNHYSLAQFNRGSVGSAVSLRASPKDVAVVEAVNGAESGGDVPPKGYVSGCTRPPLRSNFVTKAHCPPPKGAAATTRLNAVEYLPSTRVLRSFPP